MPVYACCSRLLAAAERYRSNADSRILAVAVQSKEFAPNGKKAAATEAELAEQIDSARRELQTREQELAQSKARNCPVGRGGASGSGGNCKAWLSGKRNWPRMSAWQPA